MKKVLKFCLICQGSSFRIKISGKTKGIYYVTNLVLNPHVKALVIKFNGLLFALITIKAYFNKVSISLKNYLHYYNSL